ncbi:hypothetical protein CR513_06229, partial [Mucuna pruriens]
MNLSYLVNNGSVNFDLARRLVGIEVLRVGNNVLNGERQGRGEGESWLDFGHNKWRSLTVENLKHCSHGRPLSTIRISTGQTQEQQLPHFLLLKLPIQSLVSSLNDLPLRVKSPNPVNEIHHLRPLSFNWPPCTSHLKHNHPIAENISLVSGLTILKILGCKVAHCSSSECGHRALIMIHELSQSKIPQPRVEVPIQQYVGSFNVPMNDSLLAFLVKVNQHRS